MFGQSDSVADSVILEDCSGVLIIRFQGPRIDHENFEHLDELIADYLNKNQPQRVLANLRKIDYLHSIGIGLLSGMIKHIHSYGGELRLCSLQPEVHELLTVMHLHNYFEVYDTEKSALAGF